MPQLLKVISLLRLFFLIKDGNGLTPSCDCIGKISHTQGITTGLSYGPDRPKILCSNVKASKGHSSFLQTNNFTFLKRQSKLGVSQLHMTSTEYNEDNQRDLDIGKQLPKALKFRGKVDKGYGRGGKKLGIPTANLPESLFSSALKNVSTGVYFGWAVIEEENDVDISRRGRNIPHPAVVNVGYSPTFVGKENAEKIIEAHLMVKQDDEDGVKDQTSSIEGDFYDETMRLVLIGFLRPEQKFDSFPELIAQIHFDIECAKFALTNKKIYSDMKNDGFLDVKVDPWVGIDGGDAVASWEFTEQSIA